MLEQVDLKARLSKEEYEQRKDELVAELVRLQQECIVEKLPVVVCVDGWGASGKGTTISKLVKDLDPRSFRVHSMSDPNDYERRFPFTTRYWERIGRYGTMTFFNKSWYTEAIKAIVASLGEGTGARKGKRRAPHRPHPTLRDSFDYLVSGAGDAVSLYAESAKIMERQLIADRYLIVKCFFQVSRKKQRARLEKLRANESTAWRVTDADFSQNDHYDDYAPLIDRLLEYTSSAESTWHVIPADHRRVCRIAFMEALASEMRDGLERYRSAKEHPIEIPADFPLPKSRYKLVEMPPIESVSHELAIDEGLYKEQLDREQKRLSALQPELYRRGIPMMLVFEGWDAAGKGGAIKRVASALDARDYRVVPSASPTPPEKERPFLWRYWTNLPKSGHACIYDRSWYGRVMVERIEGFCTAQEWRRAYEEINDFEWEMHRTGSLLLKFWINVSQDEQLRRFEARKNDPDKAWKLTDEDWRNREKYPQYREAIDDMMRLTSTDFAPWLIVESDDKKYARIKVLKAVNEAIEKRIAQEGE